MAANADDISWEFDHISGLSLCSPQYRCSHQGEETPRASFHMGSFNACLATHPSHLHCHCHPKALSDLILTCHGQPRPALQSGCDWKSGQRPYLPIWDSSGLPVWRQMVRKGTFLLVPEIPLEMYRKINKTCVGVEAHIPRLLKIRIWKSNILVYFFSLMALSATVFLLKQCY